MGAGAGCGSAGGGAAGWASAGCGAADSGSAGCGAPSKPILAEPIGPPSGNASTSSCVAWRSGQSGFTCSSSCTSLARMLWRVLPAMKYTTREPSSAVVNRNQPSSWLTPGCVGGNGGTVGAGAEAGLPAPRIRESATANAASNTPLYNDFASVSGMGNGFGFATSSLAVRVAETGDSLLEEVAAGRGADRPGFLLELRDQVGVEQRPGADQTLGRHRRDAPGERHGLVYEL